ncbi:hypothetical protein H5410_051990 [Solanum commersonii]|uniref:Uncharacterized protein n=1 Tax=Solanum commersonii TaxID=4109 RepID=A0A9J5WZZ6_SOLCO|nr:hypothetical protein H5410_051990 [Solanum commersonii]
MLANVTYPRLKDIPINWPQMVQYFEEYMRVLHFRLVKWEFPPQGWFKCNSDGASKGNPGPSSLVDAHFGMDLSDLFC